MEESINFSEPIQALMDNVKKDILAKNIYQGNAIYNKEIINSLFNLLDYQLTLVNQILQFNKNNNDDNYNNMVDQLININKDILVSMIIKFLNNLNSIYNKVKINGKNKCNIINKTQNFFKRGKIINLLYSNSNNNSLLVSNSFAPSCQSPIKKNMEKEFTNSTISFIQQSPIKNIEPIFEKKEEKEQDKNSYKFIRHKNLIYSMKNKNKNSNKKNVYDKLFYDKKCDHEEKKKNKILLHQSYSKSVKDIFVDLNNENLINFFNKPINHRESFNSKKD